MQNITEPGSTPIYEFDASKGGFAYARQDLARAFSNPRLIMTLIATDFAKSYRGVALGGFWIAFTTLATVSGLAVLYSQIFGASLAVYFPYVAVGIIVWGFMTGLINDGVTAFTAGSGVFNQMPLPKSLFVLKTMGRSIVALFFKLIVLVGVMIFVGVRPDIGEIFLAFLGCCLILWVGFWASLVFGVIGARFRDLSQLASVGLTFAFFVTPVFWQTERLGEYAHFVKYNPFYHFLNVVRGPLLGYDGVQESFIWVLLIAIVMTVSGWFVYGCFARRLSYWCS